MKSVAIFGSPGTGKSTRLIRIIGDLLEKFDPRKVCLVSFTRAAAEEMAERIPHKIQTSTIHSMCFRMLDMQRSMVVDRRSLIEFGKEIGLEISWGSAQDEASEMTEGDEYVSIYDLARNRKISLEETYAKKGTLGSYDRFAYFVESYENWKKEYGLADFTDMLQNVISLNLTPFLEVLLVDEAQDLSPLQWDVVNSWCKYLRICYIAGDDDQAIFEWSGADPQGMVKFSEKYESKVVVLDQSWRLPKVVHELADKTIHIIDDRLEKVYKPQPREGEIHRYSDFGQVVHTIDPEDDTLLLYRNHSLRKDIEDQLMSSGVPYLVDNGKPSPFEGRYGKMVLNWQRLQDGRSLKPSDVKAIVENSKLKIRNNDVSTLLNTSWRDVFKDHWWGVYNYFDMVERRGNTLLEAYESCNLHLSTIHGAKGREADRVILINGMGTITADAYSEDRDGEVRVFYVGVTRVKRRLDIVLGQHPVEFLL